MKLWRIGTVIAAVCIAILTNANAREIGKVGHWTVNCDWNEAAKSGSCLLVDETESQGDKIVISYDPFARRLTVTNRLLLSLAVKIDQQEPWDARCRDARCVLEDARFSEAIDEGYRIIIKLGLEGTPPSYVVVAYLNQLQLGSDLANAWLKREAIKH